MTETWQQAAKRCGWWLLKRSASFPSQMVEDERLCAFKDGFEAGKAQRPEERRMTPKQLDALRMLNDAFESHDGAPVMQAIITRTDYRLLYEALAEGTAGDRIAQELLSPPSPLAAPAAWVATKGDKVLHLAKADGWRVEVVQTEPQKSGDSHGS